jgi:hypothetical protein
MKRGSLMFSLIVATLILTSFTSFVIRNVKAADTDYSIEEVNHTIEIMYNGYVFIRDTIKIDGKASNGFLMGFPYIYTPHILQCVAYNATADFPVSLNATLEDHIGFYGVKVNFPEGTPQVFTVGFILSNNLLEQNPYNKSQYVLDFPAYPALTKCAANCNVSILLPKYSEYLGGTVSNRTYWQENLAAFTYSPANLAFFAPGDEIQIVSIKELKRQIKISGTGGIEGSDIYSITNEGLSEISFIEVILPQNVSDVSAHDQLGRILNATEKASRCRVQFTSLLDTNKSTSFTVEYSLLSERYIEQKEPRNLNLTFPLFQDPNYYIYESCVTFVLPEGAKILSFENVSVGGSYSVTRNVFQEMLTVNRKGVFSYSSFSIGVTYEYNLLWLSFRPTLWIWTLTLVGCAVAFVWKRPSAPVPVTVSKIGVRLRSKDIKSFVDVYEKKQKITLEIESLRIRVRRGKIPRRRYKVRRRTLETQLNALSRNLTDFKEKLRMVGGRYGDLMRQLEIAETEINEVEANIESIEARHRRGELSLGAYRKLHADYERRKDKAETTVNGILIRLREQLH